MPQYQRHSATVIATVAAGVADLDHLLGRHGVERAQPHRQDSLTTQLVLETWLGFELDGLHVKSVAADGLAAAAGLQPGDRWLAVGATAVGSVQDLQAALRAAFAADGRVVVEVQRGPTETLLDLRH